MEDEPGQGALFGLVGFDEDRDQLRAINRLMGIGTVERAYQLARDCSTIDELRDKLEREDCINVDAHLQGWLRQELKRLIEATH